MNKNCVYENNTITVTADDIELSSDTDCLVVPGRIWDGQNKNIYTITSTNPGCKEINCNITGNHGYEIFITNYPESNILEVNIIPPNFFTIINTKYMSSEGGAIKFKETSRYNKNLRFINITNLNDNIDGFKTNKNNNLCHNPDDNTPSKFNFTLDETTFKRELFYTGNPRIYIMGDYEACSLNKFKDIKNVFIYFDYGESRENVAKCLGKMKLSILQGSISKKFRIIENYNGYQYKTNNINNLQISFDPRNNISLNGFTNFIIINNCDDKIIKTITFDNAIINKLKRLNQCLNVRFFLASLYFSSDTTIIDSTTIKGPYKMINFSNCPKKVLVYIPPYILDDSNLMSSNELIIRKNEFSEKNFQTDYNICDIYINIIY
jgi:hypothetical protein